MRRRKRSHANGDGSITKCKGRAKPFKAVVSVGVRQREDGEYYYARKVIGYFRTRGEAEDALSDYRRSPYDLDGRKLKFSDVYERWSGQHYERIDPAMVRAYKSAYNNATSLHGMLFVDIRPAHIEAAMRATDAGSVTKNRIKLLCGLMYKWAIKNEICSVNYAAMCEGVKKDAPTIERIPITEDEERRLWDAVETERYADMVLIGLYRGWRPQELATLEKKGISLKDGAMYGGMKTDAGRNRAVPIHSKILPLVKKRMETEGEWLFSSVKDGPMCYHQYAYQFRRLCEKLGMRHAPHDVRHSFVTKAKEAGMNEYILKLIVGHAISDITEKVYTHRKIEELKAEIEKIK